MRDREALRYTRYRFQAYSGYLIHPDLTGRHEHLALGYNVSAPPWHDPDLHIHEVAEEYFYLRQGTLRFLIDRTVLTLHPNEILMVRPHIPHAIIGGEGPIEKFGFRAPALPDKRIVADLPRSLPTPTSEDERELCCDWGYRIPLANARFHNNCLIGSGPTPFSSDHLSFAYLNFPTTEAASDDIGTSHHRLPYQQETWEYHVALRGTAIFETGDDLVPVETGEILEVPPGLLHIVHSRQAPFEGFTLRVPVT